MGQSYVNLRYHIVFGTRDRQPWLLPEKRDRVYRFIADIASKSQGRVLSIGGIEDRVHILAGLHQTRDVASFLSRIKSKSSSAAKEILDLPEFAWQAG